MTGAPPVQSLVVRRHLKAPRPRVFRAWTTPEQLQRWWWGGGMTVSEVEVDLRRGGQYKVGMRGSDGATLAIVGTFVDVEPESRLVYTFAFEGEGFHNGQSLVTVEFLEEEGATEVVVTHERLRSPEAVMHHGRGWSLCLDGLDALLLDLG